MLRVARFSAVCVFAVGTAARADLSITSSARSVETYYYFTGNFPATSPPHNETTSAVGPWSIDVTSSTVPPFGVRAFQNSDVSAAGMWGVCEVDETTSHPPSLTDESSHGLSILTVDFHVDTPTEVYFSAHLDNAGVFSNSGNFSPEIWLRVANGTFLADAQYTGNPTHSSAQFQGVLQPGDYQILCAAGFNRAAYREPSFTPVTGIETAQFQFIIPSPAVLSLLPVAATYFLRRRRI